ncbi:hypothetical protein PEC301899_40370 [Pectobacterium carotovorum subsp. carotovorum]|nr:hypothetical protein PEC301899_40370 [Pectobacterium carotovorum subsp. carotovorum]
MDVKILKKYIKKATKFVNVILYELVYGYNDTALLITMMASFSSFLIHIVYAGNAYYIIGNLSFYFIVRIHQWIFYYVSSDKVLDTCYLWFFMTVILTFILFP